MTFRRNSILALGLLLVSSSGISAQSGDSDLTGIRKSLERLVELFEANLASQRSDLLLRRVEISAAQIAPLEKELRSKRKEMLGDEEELDRYEAGLQEIDDRLFNAQGEQKAEIEKQARIEKRFIEIQLESAKNQLWHRQQALQDLEDDVRDRRMALDRLQAALDSQLGVGR